VEEFFKESLENATAGEVVRPPILGVRDFTGRGDEGELTGNADFVAAVEEALRTHRYAYRTEQHSL